MRKTLAKNVLTHALVSTSVIVVVVAVTVVLFIVDRRRDGNELMQWHCEILKGGVELGVEGDARRSFIRLKSCNLTQLVVAQGKAWGVDFLPDGEGWRLLSSLLRLIHNMVSLIRRAQPPPTIRNSDLRHYSQR